MKINLKIGSVAAALVLMVAAMAMGEGISAVAGAGNGAGPGSGPQAQASGLRPGVRVSYYVSSASVAGTPQQYTVDPTGNLVDPQGTRYSANDTPTASGQGISQVTVLAGDDGKVLLETALYLIDATSNNTIRYTSASLAVAPADHVDGLYADPRGLAQLQPQAANGIRMTRGKIVLDKKEYDAIGVRSENAAGWTQIMVDAKTGFVLTSTSATVGAGAPIDPNNPAAGRNAGNTQLTFTKFLGTREVKLPWIDAKAPAWLGTLKELDVKTRTTVLGPDYVRAAGSPALVLNSAVTMTPTKTTGHWVELDIRTQTDNPGPGMPAQTQSTGILGGGGLWIDPASFARLRPGQVLDVDPITKMKVMVADGRPGPNGTQTLGYRWEMPLDRAAVYFDGRSGMFAGLVKEDRQSNRTDEYWRVGLR